ncbi:MAG: response regulator [Candidatus Dormibacteria bacterium]
MSTAVATIDILLVEDTPEDVELTLEAFSDHVPASRIHVERDGEAALKFLHGPDGTEVRGALPRVVLLDIKLPKVDGLEVLERIRQHPGTAMLPVVLLTSSAQEQDMHRGYSLHANSYIVKPVEYDEFVGVVHEIGVYWLDINRPLTSR